MDEPEWRLAAEEGFEWDEGNSEKNWIAHRVSRAECEELFVNQPLLVAEDVRHSEREARW